MTIDEKRDALVDMCENKYGFHCIKCPFDKVDNCNFTFMTEGEVDRAYNLMFPTTEPTIKGDKPTSVEQHMGIAVELNQLYEKKNKDYGDSFHTSFVEEGMAMARIRLGDKLSRFKTLTKNNQQEVKDESIRDTLIDLANYAIMTVMEIDRKD